MVVIYVVQVCVWMSCCTGQSVILLTVEARKTVSSHRISARTIPYRGRQVTMGAVICAVVGGLGFMDAVWNT